MKVEVKFEPTPLQLAQMFCDMDDQRQAQFFVEAAAIMNTWDSVAGLTIQAHYIGRHLKNCECSTPDARELVRSISESAQ